jgi:hypothetical protein
MEETKNVKVEKEYYVNKATLDYLRRCIESEVKGNFFRWIGLPVGGAGVLAIILTIFVWIPEQMKTIIETNPVIQKTLDKSALDYLNDPDKGQQFISSQLKIDIERYFKDPARGQKLIQEQIENTARAQIEVVTEEFFKSTGEPLISDLADAYLKSPDVSKLLIKTIDRALKPKTASLSEEIRQNTDKLVIETAMPSHDTKRINKETFQTLMRFLNSAEAGKIKQEKRPVALAITVRSGKRYDRNVVIDYLEQLDQFFGVEFKCILVLDNDGTFIAKLDRSFVRSTINSLIDSFNSEAQILSSAIKAKLEGMEGGKYCTDNIQSNWTVMKALVSNVWRKSTNDPQRKLPVLDLQREVPVLDENNMFIGLTSRAKLIKGILG